MRLYLPDTQQALLAELDAAGSAFTFAVWQCPDGQTDGQTPDNNDHLLALEKLFVEHLTPQWRNWTFHREHARAVPLDMRYWQLPERLKASSDYQNIPLEQWFLQLYHNFCDPPHGLAASDKQSRAWWLDFCALTGLHDKNAQVFDWIRHDVYGTEKIPHHHPISPYFDMGLEWWGVWCLTVYHPERHTLAAIVASSSD